MSNADNNLKNSEIISWDELYSLINDLNDINPNNPVHKENIEAMKRILMLIDKPGTDLEILYHELSSFKFKRNQGNLLAGLDSEVGKHLTALDKKWNEFIANSLSYIENQRTLQNKSKVKSNGKLTFNELFSSHEDRIFCIEAMENLGITKQGKCLLSSRKKSDLLGFVEAFIETGIFPDRSKNELCELLANEISMDYQAKLKYSDTSRKMYDRTNQYIKSNLVHDKSFLTN